jgi:tripartite-type tricarboxylate transporter receptor subunit TctC
MLSVRPQVQGGRLRALAITSAKRSPIVPDVPTMAETYAGFTSGSWYALFVPGGTPQAVVTRLHDAANRALQTPAVRDKLMAQGAEILGGTPQEAAAYVRAEVAKWSKVVKASGARVN